MRVLFVTPEVFPLVKTGGLADVSAALPTALAEAGVDVRLLVPGYPAVLAGLGSLTEVGGAIADLPGADLPGMDGAGGGARLRLGRTPDGVPAYAIDAPALYGRPGNPYLGPDGHDWPDNVTRFAALCWAAAAFAGAHSPDPWWRPEVIHGHDWQCGLIPAYLRHRPDRFAGPHRVGTVLTIHNIAYQGQFGAHMMGALKLPAHAYAMDGVEYYGGIGFLKAGCQMADRLTTVSPTYAHEIQTDEHGMGLQGLLSHRADALTGILNGVDHHVWDPMHDQRIAATYGPEDMAGKATCKAALQAELGLDPDADAPIAAVVSRLTWHKGLDLVLETAGDWIARGGQMVVLGGGDPWTETGFGHLSDWCAGRIAVRIGYDEGLAHRIQAGSDLILVPSRSEPCGLTQLYGLKYGTIPLVRRTGGLADTVVDASPAALKDRVCTGFQFVNPTAQELRWQLRRAMALYRQPDVWRAIQHRAMTRDFGWTGPAREYVELYRGLAG